MNIHIKKTGFIRQKFHSVIIADNGQITYTSENVTNLSDCVATANTLAKRAKLNIVFDFQPKSSFDYLTVYK